MVLCCDNSNDALNAIMVVRRVAMAYGMSRSKNLQRGE